MLVPLDPGCGTSYPNVYLLACLTFGRPRLPAQEDIFLLRSRHLEYIGLVLKTEIHLDFPGLIRYQSTFISYLDSAVELRDGSDL